MKITLQTVQSNRGWEEWEETVMANTIITSTKIMISKETESTTQLSFKRTTSLIISLRCC